jgi:hypothetical protein
MRAHWTRMGRPRNYHRALVLDDREERDLDALLALLDECSRSTREFFLSPVVDVVSDWASLYH